MRPSFDNAPAAAEPTVARRASVELITLALAAGGSVFVLFLLWEGLEHGFGSTEGFRRAMHYMRGISTSLVTAGVVVWLAYIYHRRHEQALERKVESHTRDAQYARHFLEAVVEHTPAGLMILDGNSNVVYANSIARRLHGGDVIIGMPCGTAIRNSASNCAECPAALVRSTGQSQGWSDFHTDARTGEVLIKGYFPLNLPDSVGDVLIVERIVTEQHKLQASLLHQEKMAAFGLLAAGIAHDMGNPLSAIDMHLQLIEEEELPEDASESLATVKREVGRLRRNLRDLVDFARRRRTEASWVSVAVVVQEALGLLRYDPRLPRADVQVEADHNAAPVWVVEDHLMQVVLNLLVNALDAMPDGGQLRIDVHGGSDEVALRVRDNGSGMKREELARCCEPLFTTKAPGQGTGLGLSMCKDIVEGVGGTIEFHSAPGQGTTVVVTLPITQPSTPLQNSADSVPHLSGVAAGN